MGLGQGVEGVLLWDALAAVSEHCDRSGITVLVYFYCAKTTPKKIRFRSSKR